MMTTHSKLPQGTIAWFEMVGQLMCEAASRSGLSPELNVSLVELYTDGMDWGEGLVQGIRFDIIAGRPSFRPGARPGERADVMIEITAAAARKLNSIHSADPAYPEATARFLSSGEMRIEGDPSRLGAWLSAVHDPIVDRTTLSGHD